MDRTPSNQYSHNYRAPQQPPANPDQGRREPYRPAPAAAPQTGYGRETGNAHEQAPIHDRGASRVPPRSHHEPGAPRTASSSPSELAQSFDALQTAILKGHDQIVEQLLTSKSKLMGEAITTANLQGDFSYLEQLITLEQSKNTVQFQSLDKNGHFLLSKALEAGSELVVQWILSHPNIAELLNRQDDTGKTILHEACEKYSPNLVTMLLEKGASLSIADNDNISPLGLCLGKQRWDVLDCLYRHKHCALKVLDRTYQTLVNGRLTEAPAQQLPIWNRLYKKVITEASQGKSVPLLRLLNLCPDMPGQQDFQRMIGAKGVSILRHAVEAGMPAITRWLMQHPEADKFARAVDENGDTALHTAVKKGFEEIAALLKPHSDLGAENNRKETPITLAMKHSNDWVRMLDPEIADLLAVGEGMIEVAQPVPPMSLATISKERPTVSGKAFFDMMRKYQVPEGVSIDQILRLTLMDNNFEALAYIHHELVETSDLPVKAYGNLTHLVMDDDPKRLAITYPQFQRFPGAYMVALKKDDQEKFTRIEPVVTGKKPLNAQSKVVISGHGPHMGNMSGQEFAVFLDYWLRENGCPEHQCPKITLTSCNTGAEEAYEGPFGQIQIEKSFVDTLLKTLAGLGRMPEVTASCGTVISYGDGAEICGIFQKEGDNNRVIQWQGEGAWLMPGFAEGKGLVDLTEDRYNEDIVQVYKYDPRSGKVNSKPKHPRPEEHRGGLMSLRF